MIHKRYIWCRKNEAKPLELYKVKNDEDAKENFFLFYVRSEPKPKPHWAYCYCYCYWGLRVRWSDHTYCGYWKILPCAEADYHLTIHAKRCSYFPSLPNPNFRVTFFRASLLFEPTGSIWACYMRVEWGKDHQHPLEE